MSNPKENNSLPTPENPNNSFSIKIKDVEEIYNFVTNKQYQRGFPYNDEHSFDIFSKSKIEGDFFEKLVFKIKGSSKDTLPQKNEYSFLFELIKKQTINDELSYPSERYQFNGFLSKEENKIIESRLNKIAPTTYVLTKDYEQLFFIEKGDITYFILSTQEKKLMFDNDHLSVLAWDEEDCCREIAKYPITISVLGYKNKIKKFDSNNWNDRYLPITNINDFSLVLKDFLLISQVFTQTVCDLKKIKLPNNLIVETPDFDESLQDGYKLQKEKTAKYNKRLEKFRHKEETIITNEKKINFSGFNSIAGQTRAVTEAKKLVLAINHPEIYEKRGVKTPKGILFYGPPGTGKTLIAKAIASEVNAELFEVSFSDIGSKWYGESEKRIQEIFDQANNVTKTGKKAIILFDELDSMAPSRNDSYEGSKKIVSIILQNLDGFRSNKNVLIIGTTNRPEDIDSALKRPGRIDKIIAVDLPSTNDRMAILELHINKFKENASESHDLFSPDLDVQKIAEGTENMSGADLANIINLTLETKTVLELEGLRWTPISNADIERTLVEFNLKKKEKNRIGFQA